MRHLIRGVALPFSIRRVLACKSFYSQMDEKNQRDKALTLESSKTLGGVGAILLLIGILPYVITVTFGIIALVGVILILIGLNGLAGIYGDKTIFSNSLYGFIAGIVGLVVAVVVGVAAFFTYQDNLKSFIMQIFPSWNGSWSSISSISGQTPQTANLDFSGIIPLVALLVVAFVIFWVFLIVWAFLARKSLKALAAKSGVGMFSTASLILIIGAALTIVIVGVVLIWVAAILLAIAFFQMKPQTEQPPVTYVPPPTQPTPV